MLMDEIKVLVVSIENQIENKLHEMERQMSDLKTEKEMLELKWEVKARESQLKIGGLKKRRRRI